MRSHLRSNDPLNDRSDPVHRAARRAAGRKLGFAVHATVFVLVNLAIATFATFAGRPVFAVVPLSGWGLGLLIHGMVALGPLVALRKRLVQREIARAGRGR